MNTEPAKQDKLTLALLDAVEKRSDINQRSLANQLGVALGLTNSYLKRCVRKGFIKIREAPSNRYFYYLTPKGFSEKTRLTAEYLSVSFNFYRMAGESCLRVYDQCEQKGDNRLVLFGLSDLTEIAYLKSLETRLQVVGVADGSFSRKEFFSVPVFEDCSAFEEFDCVVITQLSEVRQTYSTLVAEYGEARVRVPDILELDFARD